MEDSGEVQVEALAHITDLECRSILAALRWRLRVKKHLRTRFLHLSDSQAGIGVFTEGQVRLEAFRLLFGKLTLSFLLHSLALIMATRRLTVIRRMRRPVLDPCR